MVAMTAQQREQAAVLAADRVQVPPTGQEVVVDDADDMEAIGHDACVGEVQVDQGAVGRGQIHAHHFDLSLALQMLEIGAQRELGSAEYDIIDLVMFQVAQSGGETPAAGEEVLVNAQNLRASRRVPLAELVLEVVPEVALHGGRADGFAPPQAAAVDAVQELSRTPYWGELSARRVAQ